ncbi:MAG: T9SS type A sorting domain-containing protein [Bacteroidales bacterium]|nr:T9SS type A sorting domain-containing protein [Bacteroidales bacterium]
MKNISVFFLLMLTFLLTQAQQRSLTSDDGEIQIVTTKHSGEKQLQRQLSVNPYPQSDIDPGVYPEGDYMGRSAFTPDGQKVILTNRITDMITIYDFNSMNVLANIEVGEYPSCVAANDDYAIVGCQFADSVFFIDLSTYEISGGLPTGEQPCWIELSPGGDTAYVACDIDNTCMAIDIPSQTVLGQINDFPIYLNVYSWAVQVNRGWEKYNGFVVLPAGDRIAIVDPDNGIDFFTTDTYELIETVNIESPRAIAVSGDGEYIACAAVQDNTCRVYQVSDLDYQIISDVMITGYSLGTNEIVVNQDGSKAYIGTNNNTSTLVRFNSQDYITFSNTYTAFWLGVSHDHLYAVSGQNRFSIIDFESESVVDQHIGLNQSFGCVSPVNYHVFAYDPLRYEGAYFFDFTDPENIDYKGSKLSGADPEGDTPGVVAISNDRTTAVSSNNLSYNCSVIDLEYMQTEGTIDLGESSYDVKITSDGMWAVAGGYNENEIKIIDLSANSIATTVYTGQRPMVVELSPDGQRAYIGNIKSNTLSVVELDGANSSTITSESCGIIGVYTPFFGIRSAVKVSPDGNTVLVAASFDDEVNVFDTQSNEFVASLSTGDFPLDIAFNSDGSKACVINTFDNTFDIISVDGAASSILVHNTLSADYPLDVAYHDELDRFMVCSASSKKVFEIDPETGDIVGGLNADQSPFHIENYGLGKLVQYQGDDTYEHRIAFGDGPFQFVFPYAAAPFSINKEAGMIGVAMPGPDLVSIIDLNPPTSVDEEETAPVKVYPNPASDRLYISGDLQYETAEVINSMGNIILRTGNTRSNGIDVSGLSAGTYVLRLTNRHVSYSKLIVIK